MVYIFIYNVFSLFYICASLYLIWNTSIETMKLLNKPKKMDVDVEDDATRLPKLICMGVILIILDPSDDSYIETRYRYEKAKERGEVVKMNEAIKNGFD